MNDSEVDASARHYYERQYDEAAEAGERQYEADMAELKRYREREPLVQDLLSLMPLTLGKHCNSWNTQPATVVAMKLRDFKVTP